MHQLITKLNKVTSAQFIIIILFICYLAIATKFNLYIQDNQQFSILANSFLQGRTFIYSSEYYKQDMVIIADRYYWPLPPFPALVMMPVVLIAPLFNTFPYQAFPHLVFVILTAYLAYKIALIKKYSKTDALYLSFAFCFASTYIGVAFNSMSWYFCHAIAVMLMLLALHEYLTRQRYVYIGLLCALILATRSTAILGVLFFALEIVRSNNQRITQKITQLFKLLVPGILVLIALLYYNQIRFGNPFDSGYMTAYIGNAQSEQLRQQYGLFNLANIPTNLYWYFLNGLQPVFENNSQHLAPPFVKASKESLSVFFTSLIFLRIFTLKTSTTEQKNLWITSFIIFISIITYVFYGGLQYGTRYLLDLFPFLYILLIYSFKNNKLGKLDYAIIIINAFINAYLYTTIWT